MTMDSGGYELWRNHSLNHSAISTSHYRFVYDSVVRNYEELIPLRAVECKAAASE